MTTITVSAAAGPYPVVIERGLIGTLSGRLNALLSGRRAIMVTDETVADVLGSALAPDAITVPAGESSKSWAVLGTLLDRLLAAELERGDAVVAVGGGVVGDLAGFAAAILKRGCRLVQVPTTLLAQVDSSVGGKTGINTGAGKNLVGAFKAPDAVWIDPDVLGTLPDRQLAAGWAEVVKYGLIDDPEFFAWCEDHSADVLARDPQALTHAIGTSVRAKARVVGADERETTGARALLNLGHTFGHALEAEARYGDRLLHGEAVAAGMALALRYSVRRGLMAHDDAERAAALLKASGLPTSAVQTGVRATGATLIGHMAHDKKREGGTLPFLLARGIGRVFVDRSVELADVANFLDEEAARCPTG